MKINLFIFIAEPKQVGSEGAGTIKAKNQKVSFKETFQILSINFYDVLAIGGAAEEVEMFCFFGDECRAVFAEDRGGRIGVDHNIEHLFLAIFV